MSAAALLVERPYGELPAVRLTLCRPERKNALSIALRDEISDALDALGGDESVRCVVFTGTGDVFCSGFDLTEFTTALDDPEFADRLWASSDRYHSTLVRFPLPTLAAVNGPALAGGFDLAICCDLRVATTTARFAHPEYTFGPVVYSPLHDLVGGAVARDLCMTGRTVDADEARSLRIVNDVVGPGALDAATHAVVERVCAAPREQLVRTKAKALDRARLVAGGTLDLRPTRPTRPLPSSGIAAAPNTSRGPDGSRDREEHVVRRNRLVPVVAVVGAIALLGAACSDDDDNDASSETTTPVATDAPDDPTTTTTAAGDTIVDLAVATPDLSTLVEAVTAAGLVDTLSGEGPFTVFAPTNEAFAAIPAETLQSILADQELLTKILTYHVVAGDFPADAVAGLPDVGTGADVETVEGQSVTIVASDAGVTVNGANVVQADVVASNGVVHVIDQVILPPDVQP